MIAPERQKKPMKSPSSPKTSILVVVASLVALASSAFAQPQARELSQVHRELLGSAPSFEVGSTDPASILRLQSEDDDGQWSSSSFESSNAPRRFWTLLASAAVPGLGEALTGHWIRGSALIAADAVVWTVRFDKTSEGEDFEDEYKAMALEHWSEEQWRRAIEGDNDSTIDDNFDLWRDRLGAEEASTINEIALYVSREEDEREWFENLGKWDVFAWGWREFWDAEWNEENNFELTRGQTYQPIPSTDTENNSDTWFDSSDPYRTPLRTQYQKLRNESNDAFATRDQMTTILLLTRVFSVLQMAYLEGFVGNRFDAPVPADHGPTSRGMGLTKFGRSGTGLAWKVTY